MSLPDRTAHWDKVYGTKPPDQRSWHRAHLEKSLALIESAASSAAAILDVGGGESTLVDDLLAAGYQNVTVLDISPEAIHAAQERLKGSANRVQWIIADITGTQLRPSAYDVWHDRAVFHFLCSAEQRAAYIENAERALKPGGHLIIATFAAHGPMQCSGLPVKRYDAEVLRECVGPQFELLEHCEEVHQTPWGASQPFLYCHFRRK